MRVLIELAPQARNSTLPLDNHPLTAVIYQAVASVDPDYAEFVHDDGYSVPGNEGRRIKPFVYSRLDQAGKRVLGGRQQLNQQMVYWQVSSPANDFILRLVDGLCLLGGISIWDGVSTADFALAGISIIEPPPWTGQLRCWTLSPLFVSLREPGAKYKLHLRADDSRFGERVVANLREKYRALTGDEADAMPLDFRFETQPRSQLVQFDRTNHKCYLGRFIVRGSAELIRLGWECGFGESNSKGFGMAEALDWSDSQDE